ncbi:MAG TPA: hypothetical protein VHN11_15000 [Xanthobacteraceae bacterium]|jgi:hypothetical protein|nr:hypothetical protein [Xanthobacteraceae bacterium]
MDFCRLAIIGVGALGAVLIESIMPAKNYADEGERGPCTGTPVRPRNVGAAMWLPGCVS